MSRAQQSVPVYGSLPLHIHIFLTSLLLLVLAIPTHCTGSGNSGTINSSGSPLDTYRHYISRANPWSAAHRAAYFNATTSCVRDYYAKSVYKNFPMKCRDRGVLRLEQRGLVVDAEEQEQRQMQRQEHETVRGQGLSMASPGSMHKDAYASSVEAAVDKDGKGGIRCEYSWTVSLSDSSAPAPASASTAVAGVIALRLRTELATCAHSRGSTSNSGSTSGGTGAALFSPALGGASLQVLVLGPLPRSTFSQLASASASASTGGGEEGDIAMWACAVVDRFDGSYDIRCPAHTPTPTSASASASAGSSASEGGPLTWALIPVFDYEGFSAYSELPPALAQRRLGLGRLDAFGRPLGLLLTVAELLSSNKSKGEVSHVGKEWGVPFADYNALLRERRLRRMPLLPPLRHLLDAALATEDTDITAAAGGTDTDTGTGTNNTTIATEVSMSLSHADRVRLCLVHPHRPIRFLGDSHSRYVFDYLVGLYLSPTPRSATGSHVGHELGQGHGSTLPTSAAEAQAQGQPGGRGKLRGASSRRGKGGNKVGGKDAASIGIGDPTAFHYHAQSLVTVDVIDAKASLLQMPHHHAHAKFPLGGSPQSGYVSYYPVRFLLQLSGMLATGDRGGGGDEGDLWCKQEGSEEVTTLVVGPGAWDLDYSPLRDFLEGGDTTTTGYGAPQLIHALRTLLFKCSGAYKIIWITTVPNPEQSPENVWGSPGYRNNYSIAAFNEYFMRELLEIQGELDEAEAPVADAGKDGNAGEKRKGPHQQKETVLYTSSITIVDAFNLILPHSAAGAVCKNHYLCWSGNKGSGLHWDTLHTGVAFAELVLGAMCGE